MTELHISTTIIDPSFGNTDLNKREILHLLGHDDNMLGACPPAIEWIGSLPDDVQGQWIWDHLPDFLWYCWLLNELWDVERKCIAEADPDWFDLASSIEEEFQSQLETALAATAISQLVRRCLMANMARYQRISIKKYPVANEKYQALFERVKRKLFLRIVSSSETQVIEVQYAKQVRNSGWLPDWEQVRTVFRHFYEQESVHATEFWEEHNNG